MQLEAVVLQEPAEKRMDWKSEPAYPLSFGGAGDVLCLLSALIGGESGSNRNHEDWGKKSLGLERH